MTHSKAHPPRTTTLATTFGGTAPPPNNSTVDHVDGGAKLHHMMRWDTMVGLGAGDM